MQIDNTHKSKEAQKCIEFISINKTKVIYQDATGFIEKNFASSAQARDFVANLTSKSN